MRHSAAARRLVAAATALAGGLTLAGGIAPGTLIDPDTGRLGPLHGLLAVVGGGGLLLVARGLARGRRAAADAALALLLGLALLRTIEGGGPVDGLIELAFAAVVLLFRPAFPCVPERRGRAGIVGAGVLAVAAGGAAYALYATIHLHEVHRTTVDVAIGRALHGTWWLAPADPRLALIDVLLFAGVVAAATALHRVLRPAAAEEGHTPEEHARAAALVERWGSDSLAPFALREDKAFHFAADGFLAYRTLRETAVVSGDPIAPPGRGPAVLADFLRHAESRGWDVVVTAAGPENLAGYRKLGLRSLRIGDEAVVDPRAFSLEGRWIRKVRQSVVRARRRGWAVELVPGHRLDERTVGELSAVESAWRAGQPRLTGFAMTLGRLWGAHEDERALFVLARDPAGTARAFLRFAAVRDTLSLDAMRRTGGEPNGIVEAMVVAALEYAREQGIREVSLNFAGFAHLMAANVAVGGRHRLARAALRTVHGRFQLERLVRFNEKFGPSWRPRHLVYARRTQLLRAGLRVLQAEAYVRPPRCRSLSGRWRPALAPTPSSAPSALHPAPPAP